VISSALAQTQHTDEPFFAEINMPTPGKCARALARSDGVFAGVFAGPSARGYAMEGWAYR